MAVTLPRLVVAAPASSQGKTTVALGLMAALRERGLQVAPFKTGPDYIDPGYHTLAAGRTGRNLDAHLCGAELMAPLLLHGAATPSPADIAVIEGAMGLFDGQLGAPPDGHAGIGSSAHVAKLVQAPVLLVVDAAHSSRTAAAVAHGLAHFDDRVQVGGVLLNRVGSQRNAAEITRALAEVGLPVVGALPRSKELTTPSRHLGLVPAAEREQAAAVVAEAARLVTEHVDLDLVLRLAARAPALDATPWDPRRAVTPVAATQGARPRIAVAAGRAFTFRYAETAELLQAAGCQVVEFDPLHDAALPPRTAGLYLGGGFPEVYADELAANQPLRTAIRDAVHAGLPTVAECAGLLYLCEHLDERPMAAALELSATMSPRLTLGYRRVRAATDSLLARREEQVATHEFHRTHIELPDAGSRWPDSLAPAWLVDGHPEGVVADPAGTGRASVHAAYQHLHWAGFPHAAQRFAQAAAEFAAGSHATTTAPAPTLAEPVEAPNPPARPLVDLTHHGDQDATPGLVDLAVNVRATAPPSWLAAHLARPERWAAYPDPSDARQAIAAAHGVPQEMVLPTAGAAEAFTLVARALAPRWPLVVHPQFTEPEQALRTAGHLPRHHVLQASDGFRLDAAAVDPDADLVVVGNPTNPTSVLHPRAELDRLRRPGRVLLVDEAFLDAVPGEPETMIGTDMTGVLVTRSLTKTWSLAGLRAGYVVGDPELVRRLAEQQPHWSVGTPALDAMVACSSESAREQAHRMALDVSRDRDALVRALHDAGFGVTGRPRAPFVLLDTSALGPGSVREPLATLGFAVRRGETFPGLGPQWIRLAVRDAQTSLRVADALARLRSRARHPGGAPDHEGMVH